MRSRPVWVISGLSLLFIASLLLVAKPPAHLSVSVPPATLSSNVPYFLYVRVIQRLFQFHSGSPMIANGLLMLLTSLLVFRAGWALSDPSHRLLGGATAMILFNLNPLVLVLPLTMGFLGGTLLVPLLLMFFMTTMLAIENWSVFMRAIVLSVVWSLFLWVHVPTAIIVLAAMIPWVFYNRRPLPALGIFLTVMFLGSLLFSATWSLGCALARHWAMVQGPVDTLKSLGGYFVEGLTTAGGNGQEIFQERLVHVMAWISPFFLFLGLWSTGQGLRHMFRERRTTPADLMSLISLVVMGVVMFCPGKDTLPGSWYMLLAVVCWCPLLARSLAKKENFFSRGFRWTTLAGFVVCGGVFFALHLGSSRGLLIPDAAALINLVGAVMLAGGVFHGLLKKHPLTVAARIKGFLTGATLAYFLVMGILLFK